MGDATVQIPPGTAAHGATATTDADWILYCITAAAVIIAFMAIATLFKNYPVAEMISQTYNMMVPP